MTMVVTSYNILRVNLNILFEEQDDDDDDVNIQPVKLDTLGTRTVDDVPPIKQDKAKAKDKKKDKEKKKETEKQKKKKKSEPAEENDILDYAW